MTKAIFVFIATNLMILPLLVILTNSSVEFQLILCLPFILLLGIPHGAIDHVLYARHKPQNTLIFVAIYVFIVLVNVALWLLIPVLGYLIFLMISAFHFGQSQLNHYEIKSKLNILLQLLWGVFVLSGLILFNASEISNIGETYPEFGSLTILHQEVLITSALYTCSLGILGIMIWLVVTKELTFQQALMESLVLFLIQCSFFLMPLLIGFTIYFVVLHSFKVLREEYHYLSTELNVRSYGQFIKLLGPFSLLSILGLVAAYIGVQQFELDISFGYVLLVIVSSITLPHVFVMDRFYSSN